MLVNVHMYLEGWKSALKMRKQTTTISPSFIHNLQIYSKGTNSSTPVIMLQKIFTTSTLMLFALSPLAALSTPAVPGPAIPVNHPQAIARRAELSARRDVWRRDVAEHCIDDAVDQPDTTGNLLCLDLGGIPPGKRSEIWEKRHNLKKRDMSPTLSPRDPQGRMTCDECLGRNGGTPAVTESETTICYITIGDPDTYGNQTSCPGDPAPATVS